MTPTPPRLSLRGIRKAFGATVALADVSLDAAPGEMLTLHVRPGETWEKQGRRGGLLTFREVTTDYVDKDGDVVVQARSVSVMTSQTVRD